MATSSADRGRDIAVDRVIRDSLGGVRRPRVIVQCKNWRTRSVGRNDIIECVEGVRLWEPPMIDVVIVATSGRFTQDAVALIEKWDRERRVPRVEPWPDSHIEVLLQNRSVINSRLDLS